MSDSAKEIERPNQNEDSFLKKFRKQKDMIKSLQYSVTRLNESMKTIRDTCCTVITMLFLGCIVALGAWAVSYIPQPIVKAADPTLRYQIEAVLNHTWYLKFSDGGASPDEFDKARKDLLWDLYENCPYLVPFVIRNEKLLYATKRSSCDYKQMKTHFKILDDIPDHISCEYIEKKYWVMGFLPSNPNNYIIPCNNIDDLNAILEQMIEDFKDQFTDSME